MKKIFSISVIAAFAFCMFTSIQANAQKVKFAGTVKFNVKYEGDTDPQKHVPGEFQVSIFGNKAKLQSGIQLLIMDGEAYTTTVLLDFPGEPMGSVIKKEELQEMYENIKYTYTKKEETKTICGYVCTRYDIKKYDVEEDEETNIIVYTTTEIGDNNNINNIFISYFPGLTGFPLYVESESNGAKQIQEATEVKKTKLKAVDFLVPSKYKVYDSQEEMGAKIQELYGGGEE